MKYPITFGKYLLLERINVGGMAEVYKSKTFGVEGFERILAIKRILPNMADDDEFINMFVDEARISVQLSHANIVQIYELGKYDGQYYIAMEYVPGKDLRQLLDRVRKKKQLLPQPAVAFLVSKICDGLDYAHRKTDPTGRPMNVIHRDVSPQNILVSYEGAVKVTDFGIAKAEDRASKTQAGVLKGKFGYMSPEQVRGMEIDRRSDVFAVGILLYEMVTGKRLFIGESDFSTLEKVRNADVPSPRDLNPDIPEELERVVLKALTRERDDRYQWASDLHDDLQQFLIEGTTIYNAKRLAAYMKDEFGQEIDIEASKMEEFMRVQPPDGMVQEAASHQAASPQQQQGWTGGGNDNKAAKTMIFEAHGGFADAPTQIADETNAGPEPITRTGQGQRPRSRTHAPGARTRARTGARPAVSVVAGRPKSRRTSTRDGGLPKNAGPIAAAAMSFIVLLVLLILIIPGNDTGTIIITSTPTFQVDIYLDGTLIGSKTPLTQGNVEVGKHKLEARAAGFKDKAYLFNLAADAPAVIAITLEPGRGSGSGTPPDSASGTEQPAPGNATLIIETDPPGASVRVAGLPQGTTPLTLSNQSTRQPINVELSKAGYRSESQAVTFTAAEVQALRKIFRHKLTPEAAPAATGAPSITVESVPTSAAVSLDSRRIGMTPVRIPNLDSTRRYTVAVYKSGYEIFSTQVVFDGKSKQNVLAQLHRIGGGRPSKDKGTTHKDGGKKVTRKDGGHKESGGKKDGGKKDGGKKDGGKESGGGKCSGSGAKLSVMAIGAQNCKVSVGKKNLGVAPFFKKPAPIGNCAIRIACDAGKKFTTTKKLKSGDNEKVIIKDGMWQ